MIPTLLLSLAGVPRWLRIGGGALLLAAVLWGGASWWLSRRDAAQRETGAVSQREADQAAIIERTEKADATREDLRRPGGRARYDQCLRTARTPANCERFLPDRQADQR